MTSTIKAKTANVLENLKVKECRTKSIHSVGRHIFQPEAIIVLKIHYIIEKAKKLMAEECRLKRQRIAHL